MPLLPRLLGVRQAKCGCRPAMVRHISYDPALRQRSQSDDRRGGQDLALLGQARMLGSVDDLELVAAGQA